MLVEHASVLISQTCNGMGQCTWIMKLLLLFFIIEAAFRNKDILASILLAVDWTPRII